MSRPRSGRPSLLLACLLAQLQLLCLAPMCRAQEDPPADPGTGISGLWRLEGGTIEVEVRISDREANGVIVRDLAPAPAAEAPAHPVVGWKIWQHFTRDADGTWNGRMYNVRNGNDYACWMRLEAPGRLIVRPYKGISLFGKTHVFLRPPSPAPAPSRNDDAGTKPP